MGKKTSAEQWVWGKDSLVRSACVRVCVALQVFLQHWSLFVCLDIVARTTDCHFVCRTNQKTTTMVVGSDQ